MMTTAAQRKAAIVKKAKARLRLEQLRYLSEQGVPLQEAAERIGMAYGGARKLLRREVGTSCWPIPALLTEPHQ